MDGFLNKMKKVRPHIWAFILIMAIGIFLRTYHFRDWLYFGSDQVRDLTLTQQVIQGEKNLPLFGPHMNHADVFVGPIYYYLQIISGKIFGTAPEKMAYPDLFFGILSIQLLYLFLKRYFSRNISLAATAVYSVSFYAIQYSRFALNPNSSPFFVLLFLLSLYEFLIAGKKTSWLWITTLGIAVGVGVQLHAITLILFSAISFLAFIFMLRKDWLVWKKWLTILSIVLFLNLGQLIGDYQNNFSNIRSFFNFSLSKSSGSGNDLAENLKLNADCHIQTNFFIVSGLGEKDECLFLYDKLAGNKFLYYWKKLSKENFWTLPMLSAGLIFSIIGYWLLFSGFKKEKDKNRKYFLGLMILYIVLSFLITFPMGDWLVLRYFIHLIFVPFLFLSLLADFLSKKFTRWKLFVLSAIFIAVILSNVLVFLDDASNFAQFKKSHYNYAVLGEIDSVFNYIISESYPKKEAYFSIESESGWTLYSPLKYRSSIKNFNLFEVKKRDLSLLKSEKPLFYFEHNSDNINYEVNGYKTENYKKFGQFVVYRLQIN